MAKRWDILIKLLRNRPHYVGAEIGVFEGDTSVRLLEALPRLQCLFCVDPWEHYPDHTATLNPKKAKFYGANFKDVEATFRKRVKQFGERVRVLQAYSKHAASLVPDGSLDFVFIDGNHAYDYVKDDILLWGPKVKVGGVIAGHDFGLKGSQGNFGVTRAVREIFNQNFLHERYVWWHEIGVKSPFGHFTGKEQSTDVGADVKRQGWI